MAKLCSIIFRECILHYKYDVKAYEEKNHHQINDVDNARKHLNPRTRADDTKMLFSIAGTLIASCFLEWQLWGNLFIFWVVRWLKYHSTNNVLPALLNISENFCYGITIFLVVFYLTQSYSRYTLQYDFSRDSSGRVFNCCSVARASLSKAGSWRMFRLLNAAHLLAYVGLDCAYNEENMFNPLIEKYHLLTPVEVKRLKQVGLVGGNAHREVIAWAMLSISKERLSDLELATLSTELLKLRESLANLYHFADLSVPFSYVHCINFQVFLFLPLYAYSLAYSYNRDNSAGQPYPGYIVLGDSMIEFLFLFWYTAVILSLRTLAQKLQDPFGHNLEDFPVIRFITKTIAASSKLLCALPLHQSSENEEAGMFSERKTFGKLFQFEPCSIISADNLLEMNSIVVCDESLYSNLSWSTASFVDVQKRLWSGLKTGHRKAESKDSEGGCWCWSEKHQR